MATIAAVAGAAASAYGAYQMGQSAKDAAKGSQVTPYGNTGAYMDSLLADAMAAWNAGEFQFGADPGIYNSFLDYGGTLGIDTSGFQRTDPNQVGYGPAAYAQMLDLVQGPAWRGASQTDPGAMVGVQNPWVAGLMGGLGGYSAAGGFDPRTSTASIPAITGSGPVTGVRYPTQTVSVDPADIIYSAVPS